MATRSRSDACMLVIAASDLGADLIQKADGLWAWRTLTAYSGGWQTIDQAAKDFLKHGTADGSHAL